MNATTTTTDTKKPATMPRVRFAPHMLPTARRRKAPTKRRIAEARLTMMQADYRDAVTILAALIHKRKGRTVRLKEKDFLALDLRSRIETTVDPKTRDLIIKVHDPEPAEPAPENAESAEPEAPKPDATVSPEEA